MTPTEVNKENTFQTEQTFATASDEFLYGMGQYQEASGTGGVCRWNSASRIPRWSFPCWFQTGVWYSLE